MYFSKSKSWKWSGIFNYFMVKVVNFVLLNFTRVFTRLLLNSIKIFKKMILFTSLTLRFLKFQLLDTYTYSKALKKTFTRHFRFYLLFAISTYSKFPWLCSLTFRCWPHGLRNNLNLLMIYSYFSPFFLNKKNVKD